MMMAMSVMSALTLTIITLKHPLSMGLMLIAQTVMVAVISGMMIKSFMMSYIITIIMISGSLVLFIYMASMASNEKMKLSMKPLMVFMIMITVSLAVNIKNKTFTESTQMTEFKSFNKLFNYPSVYMIMGMIVYLFFTMVVVSMNANTCEGPLRIKNYE
uniref:NADH-ubiquinone oxidoreductase chain 6 n=1 Tax=Coptosoma bifarium TaxID=1589673 RepID=B7SM98_COPBI|nr:NADH dehydrogenase subunit 6 [Coptosoma bifarium]ABZ01992.1 NADH dehydrogenase subunit 6 [Coptosoma bifarium]